jgi:hypothetical protein
MSQEIDGWEICKHDKNCADSQIIDGVWYHPVFGCDSLQMALSSLMNRVEELEEEIDDLRLQYKEDMERWR